MPPLNLLIKPASSNCNMKCKYCFYYDVATNRNTFSFGMMSEQTLEIIIKKAFEYADVSCTFAFQGGEPTLRGLQFYYKLIELQKKYNQKGVIVQNTIQTNGYVIDEEWAQFLGNHHFLVGLSLDGNKQVHDRYRLDYRKNGTHKAAMHAVQLFNKYKVEFNVLSVVTSYTAKHITAIYNFFMRNNLRYQQYIPCIDPFQNKKGEMEYSLTPKLYGQFLKTLFDLWYRDVVNGTLIYNRYFDNLVAMAAGYPPESCSMVGHCSNQIVIEADGGVYPCDFYVLDEYKIGNIITDNFDQIDKKCKETGFIEKSLYIPIQCKSCRYLNLCRGGCRRDREPMIDGHLSLNCYCEAYKEFFEHAYDRIMRLAYFKR